MADFLISIVMPSFNQAHFIERSIQSVLNQNYPNIELIVIDGGSEDGTVEILKKYSNRLAYWESLPDNGQSHALNKGFKKIRGEICGWLNSDDLYCEGAFRIAVELFQKEPQIELVFGDHFTIDKNDTIIEREFSFDFNIRHFVYEGFHLNSQAAFWKRSLLNKFGEFDESLHKTMDYDMLLRFGKIAGEKAFRRVDSPLACFRRHESQKTQRFDDVTAKEHKYIATKNGYNWKYSPIGRLLWALYRLRRAFWYVKRGGIKFIILKMSTVFKNLMNL